MTNELLSKSHYPEPEPPEIADRERVMVIEVADENADPLTGYNIEISGPISTSASNVSESTFRFENLESGEYEIVVTLEGYLQDETTLEVELPEDARDDFEIQGGVALTKLAPAVTISNEEENTVEIESQDEEAEEDEKVVMNIPANTFPAEALDEDGNVQLRVTRAQGNATPDESDGINAEVFAMEPAGVTLNNPIEVSIPINAIPGVEYVLMPGNIPLTLAATKGSTSSLTAQQRTVQSFSGNINILQNYSIVIRGVTLSRQSVRETVTLNPSTCGEDHTFRYETPKVVNVSPVPSEGPNFLPLNLRKIFTWDHKNISGPNNTISVVRQLSNDNDNFRFTGSVVKNQLLLTFTAGSLNETYTRNLGLTLTSRSEDCHGTN